MKIRESGMPEELYWESFFDPESILAKLQFDDQIIDAVEFGCGYGTFTIPAAKIIKGNLFALDIDPAMIKRLKKRIAEKNLTNIKLSQIDFVKEGTKTKDKSIDYAMLFNVLHCEDPVSLLKEAYRILKNGGKIGVMHWIYSAKTPRGPSLNIRPKPEQCIEWLKFSGFSISDVISLPQYHYGILASKIISIENAKA